MDYKVLNVGDKVVHIRDGVLRRGTIKYVCSPICSRMYQFYFVEFEDGTVERLFHDNLAPESKSDPQPAPVKKSKITITPTEFLNIASRIVTKNTVGRPMVASAVSEIAIEIYRALFFESHESE